ncbi:hypothetical protein [Agrobacterium pusense]|uniref:hypothetical protein n=1 Tax=Agrobacterium pusense TaxID=648995 RepID=UPI00130E8BD7|nr:hypothetical protein [Agrobacterium pusense]MBW9079889.1 hypothetical protein [Agrobacterium pusense]WKD43788.1 hypothetical protein M8C82_08190 [Agrobacterium pusense]
MKSNFKAAPFQPTGHDPGASFQRLIYGNGASGIFHRLHTCLPRSFRNEASVTVAPRSARAEFFLDIVIANWGSPLSTDLGERQRGAISLSISNGHVPHTPRKSPKELSKSRHAKSLGTPACEIENFVIV